MVRCFFIYSIFHFQLIFQLFFLHSILSDHVRLRYPRQPTRFGRLLLLLPSLRAIRPFIIESLFFKETIGSVPISRLLGDMYQMEKYTEAEK